MLRTTAAFAALLLFLARAPLRAAEEAQAPDDLPKLIAQLGSDEYAEREDAMRALLRIGRPAVEPLKQALATRKDPEFVLRANRVIRLYEGGGEAVNGLTLTLSCDKPTVAPGEELKLKITLANQNETPLKVNVGYQAEGQPKCCFETGTGLRSLLWADDWGRAGPRVIELRPRMCFDPFRGKIVITPPLYATVAGKSTLSYELTLTFRAETKDGGYETLGYYQLGDRGCLALDATATGTHRLRFCHSWNRKDHEPSGGAPAELQSENGAFTVWEGAVFSNEIEVKVAVPEKKPK